MEKFKYNQKTLSFEPLYKDSKEKTVAVLKYIGTSVLSGLAIFLLFSLFFDTPQERHLKHKLDQIKTQYHQLNTQLDQALLVLTDLEQRDDNIYRAILGSEPLPENARIGASGGIDKYRSYRSNEYIGLTVQTSELIDRLSSRLVVQSESFDDLIGAIKQNKDMMAAVPAIQPLSNNDLRRPPYGYGPRIDPVYKIPAFHHGMDFSAPTGTEIYATGDGVVTRANFNLNGFGNHVKIDHGFGYETLYAHMHKILVKYGQKVKRGQLIGLVGNTGKSIGPHLHYEVHHKGIDVNPIHYFFSDLTTEQYAKLVKMAEANGTAMD